MNVCQDAMEAEGYGTACRVTQDTASPFMRVAPDSAGSRNSM